MTPQRPNVEYPNQADILKPDWIVGFIDGEGCFHIGINKNDEVRFGYQILPELTVVQHEENLNLLYRLRSTMKCGVVRRNHGKRFCWRVRNLKNLAEIIIPFFGKYPLKSKKNIEFQKFARVVRLMQQGKHLREEGFNEILKIASEMNRRSRKQIRIKIESTL
ncbi:MAG: LAGLIDADG family homing endonuclease [bacterium]